MADPQAQWYTMQVQGKWYKTQATSEADARSKISGSLNLPAHYQVPGAGHVSAAHPLWSEQALDDLNTGSTNTLVGKTLHAFGYKGLEGTGELGKMFEGPLYGPLEAAHGAAISARPGQTTSGLMEMMGGIFHGTALAAGATQPGFLNTFARFNILQSGGEKIAQKLGLSPQAGTWASLLLATMGEGGMQVAEGNTALATFRQQAVEAEKATLRAQRGFGAQTNEQAIARAAEENVAKAEAQANNIRNIAKQTGQTVADVLQKSASSVINAGEGEKAAQDTGKKAASRLPESKPEPTVQEKIAQFRVELEAAHQRELEASKPKLTDDQIRKEQITKAETAKATETQRQAQVPIEQAAREAQAKVAEGPERTKRIIDVQSEQAERARKTQEELESLRTQRAQELEAIKRQNQELKSLSEVNKAFGAPPEAAAPSLDKEGMSRLEVKQAEMKARQAEAQAKLDEANQFIENHRKQQAAEADRLRKTNAALRAQTSTSPELGGEPTPPEASRPAAKPVQAAEAKPRRGEPVRPAEVATLGDVRQRLVDSLVKEHNLAKEDANGLADKIMSDPKAAESVLASGKSSETVKTLVQLGQLMAKRAETEPRSLRGDLGERPPAQPRVSPEDFRARMELQRQMVESMQADPKYKGVSKTELQRIASEKIRSQRGAFGGGGPEDIRGRREAKIQRWLDTLRDPKAHPKAIDDAYRMLQAYGLSHDDIIQRMAGGAEFAKTPDEADQALADSEKALETPREQRGSEPGLIDELIGKVDKVMGQHLAGFSPNELEDWRAKNEARIEGSKRGAPDVSGVKSPDLEELERIASNPDTRQPIPKAQPDSIFRWEDERGFWRIAPPKNARLNDKPLVDSLRELTNQFDQTLKATSDLDSAMKNTERAVVDWYKKTGADFHSDWAGAQMALAKLTGHMKFFERLRSNFAEPLPADYQTAVGRFSGSLNRNFFAINDFIRKARKVLPDEGVRRAISWYLQAGGDDQKLGEWLAKGDPKVRVDIAKARNLSAQERAFAGMIREAFDARLHIAIQQGILSEGLENYIPQIWEKPEAQNWAGKWFGGLDRGGMVKTTFNSAKQRIHASYFEGIQSGLKPKNMDVLYLLGAWDKAFAKTLASRNLVRDLSTGKTTSGEPILAPYGRGNPLYGSVSPEEAESPSSYVIRPQSAPDELDARNYRTLDHPAFTKWVWATQDENGAPIFVKGDLRVHKDHFTKLDGLVNRGRWAQDHPLITGTLKAASFFKQSLLAGLPINPFHQIQEGLHAAFHKVNPFNPGAIDLTDPHVNKLLDHGLVIANHDPLASFEEGVSAGGIWGKIPGIGRLNQKYTEYLFQDYIPRLKTRMATEAYARNLKRYSDDIAQGKITEDMIASVTANQANAAFGELNYMMLGRHPQTQAALRLMLFAPDFFEARARFVGQALRPYGREQYAALLRGAAGLYVTTRILNKIFDNDYHWTDEPFAVIANGYRYTLRSLPEDVWRLWTEPSSFIAHRINPVALKTGEFAVGVDDFGRKRALGERVINLAAGLLSPFQAKGWTDSLLHNVNRDKVEGVLQSFAVSRAKHRSPAATLAHQFNMEGLHDVPSHHVGEIVRDLDSGQYNPKRIQKLVESGDMTPQDVMKAWQLARLPEIWRDYRNLPVAEKAKVYAKASPKERMILNTYAKHEFDMTKLLPAQRQEFIHDYTESTTPSLLDRLEQRVLHNANNQ